MLRDEFYVLSELKPVVPQEPGKETFSTGCTAVVILKEDHPVYQGHFPGNPVVPGVCQIEMVREIASIFLGQELFLKEADPVKFLAALQPFKVAQVRVDMDIRPYGESGKEILATISEGDQVYLKFRGKFETA